MTTVFPPLVAWKKLFFFFFLLIILSSSVLAIGISPPTYTEEFQAEESFTYTYNIINRGAPTGASLRVYGSPLAEYVEFPETIELNQGLTPVEITINLPAYEDLPDAYGKQIVRIFVKEEPLGGGTFSAVTAVEGWLIMNVPVPGEYGQITSLTIPTVEEGFNTEAEFAIRNRGTLPMENKRAVLTIKDVSGTIIDELTYRGIDLAVDEEQTYTLDLPAQNYDSARYIADLEFFFDEEKQPATRSTGFFVGSIDIQLITHTELLEEGKINRVKVTLQSLWGDALSPVRGTLLDFVGDEISLPVIDLDPFQESVVDTFIQVPLLEDDPFNVNTSVQKNTTYETILRLQFPAGETLDEIKEIPIEFVIYQPEPEVIVEEKEPLDMTTIIIIALGVFVIALLVVLVFILFKKGDANEKSSKRK